MQLPPGGLVVIITPEQAALKSQERFDHLLDLVRQASHDGERIDTVEQDLMRHLLALGHDLLALFIANQGDGDLGPTVEAPEGRTLHRLPRSHVRRYVSLFGEFTIPRVVYGTREGQKIECVPLDRRLGLPEGDFSYVLEDWGQRFCLKESFAEAGRSLEMLLGLDLGRRTLEQMNRTVAGYAPAFRAAIEPPSPEEEGPLLVVTADGKGVPMRKPEPDGPQPHHRATRVEKRNKKQMACVGAVYSIEPLVRTADDILDEVLRDKQDKDRPVPQHKQVRGNERQVVKSAIEYLENNREHLKYDEYLAAGYPIGSGVAEGACRHLVKDRLEQTGMRWTVTGAQAMLHVRALYLNDEWEDYLEFRVEQEQDRLYHRDAA